MSAEHTVNLDDLCLSKAEALACLYNNSRPLGMGFLHFTPQDMTVEEAQKMLDDGQTYFDYVNGRVMKIDLSTTEVWTRSYNQDNGEGAAEHALVKYIGERALALAKAQGEQS